MRRLRVWIIRLTGLFNRSRWDRDLAAEIESHLQLHIADNLRAGMTPEEARRQALLKLGGVEATKERYRDRLGLPRLESLRQDVRFGVRLLRKNSGYTIVAVLPLALGIGTTTTIFSVLAGVLLRPLPYADADRIFLIAEHRPNVRLNISAGTFRAWRDSGTTIEGIAAVGSPFQTLRTTEESVRLRTAAGSANLFDLLGTSPALGRFFRPEEDQPDANRVVVLSHGLWQNRFAGDEQIIGRSITLDDEPHTIIGVAPAGFYFPERETELWTSHTLNILKNNPRLLERWSNEAIARLKPGVTVAQAEAEATAIAQRANIPDPRQSVGATPSGPRRVQLISLLDHMTGSVRRGLVVLTGAVVVVLLIASLNVAGLLLVGSLSRRRELAIRAALGATAGRIARELFVSSLLIGLIGGALGILLAFWLHRALPAIAPSNFPRLDAVVLDGRIITFGLVTSTVAVVLCGIAPAWYGARLNLIETLHDSATMPIPGLRQIATRRVRTLLLVGEIALSCALLVVAGLLARSFVNLSMRTLAWRRPSDGLFDTARPVYYAM